VDDYKGFLSEKAILDPNPMLPGNSYQAKLTNILARWSQEAALGHKLERYIERFGHINVQWQADTLKTEVDCEKS